MSELHGDLIRELEETAAWIKSRAAVLATGQVKGEALKAEVARWDGRADLLRIIISNAKGGAVVNRGE